VNKRIAAILILVCGLAIYISSWSQTNEMVRTRQSSKTRTTQADTSRVLMNLIAAQDSNYIPGPFSPTSYFDITYYSVAADDSIIFTFYDTDSSGVSYWRPIPKLVGTPITRRFVNVPILGIGVVRADTANTFYEILFYQNPTR